MTKIDFPIILDDCTLDAVYDNCNVPCCAALDDKTYKLILVKDKTIRFSCCGNEYKLAAGQSALLLPFEAFEILQDPLEASGVSVIVFTLNSGKSIENFGNIKSALPEPGMRIFADASLNAAVENICLELAAEDRTYLKQLLSLLCSQMLLYLLRNMSKKYDSAENADANLRICGQVMSYIDSRLYNIKNLREVATAIGYNYSYISTLFRKVVGTTLNAYFKTKRMNEARKLLQDEKMSISEIARIMNYSSVYAFSKAFKEHFGASPGHYSGRFQKKDV